MYVYVITNKITGHLYVGKTSKSTVEDRWHSHLRDRYRHSTKLYNAINKYGPDSFDIHVMEYTGPKTREFLNEREKYWIEILEPEYNMTKGGDGGWIHDQTGRRWKIKDTSRMKGKKAITSKVLKGRNKVSGGNNYQSQYTIHTPWGVFETWLDATNAAKTLRDLGHENVITDRATLQKYCCNNVVLSKEGRRTFPEWRGKSTRSLNFYIEEK